MFPRCSHRSHSLRLFYFSPVMTQSCASSRLCLDRKINNAHSGLLCSFFCTLQCLELTGISQTHFLCQICMQKSPVVVFSLFASSAYSLANCLLYMYLETVSFKTKCKQYSKHTYWATNSTFL